MRRICVFCASSLGVNPAYARVAYETGQLLARQGIGVVYGGGNVGLMGALADGALAAGGEVIGVIPHALEEKELAHRGVAEMRVVRSMHERKQLMHDLSDGFIALPGGLGTLDELFEALTWLQLGFHQKPVGIVNTEDFYDPLLEMVAHATKQGLVRLDHARMLLVDRTPEGILEQMKRWVAPDVEQWLRRGEN